MRPRIPALLRQSPRNKNFPACQIRTVRLGCTVRFIFGVENVDIAGIKASERIVDIVHPVSGEKLGITISLMSYDDPRMKSVRRRITNRRLQLDARGKHFKAEELEENNHELCFSAMTGWSWDKSPEGDEVTFNGKKPDFNKVNVFAVFEELPWFREQVDQAIADEKAFFTASN